MTRRVTRHFPRHFTYHARVMDTLFFIVSKLVWALLKPGTWIVLLLGVVFLLVRADMKRAAVWAAGGGFLFVLALAVLPLDDVLLSPLERAYPVNPDVGKVAGIIVLGGGEGAQRTARWGQPQVNEAGDRFLAALALARRHPEAPVLFTGGIGSLRQDGPTGAEVAEVLLLASGLDRSRLLLESRSRNTAENAAQALALRPAEGNGAWLLVTSAFHMPRSVEAFCAAGWTDLVPWPTDYRTVAFSNGIGWNLVGNLDNLQTALREYLGLLAYRTTGRADRQTVAACLKSRGQSKGTE
jgi:uncharacterized SAM-binding protein YcdF (DUF218 family)